jgi:hypothetical protein
MDARRAWKQWVRHRLRHNRQKVDSELQAWNEAAAWAKHPQKDLMKVGAVEAWAAWADIKDSFTPNVEPVWITGAVLEAAAGWLGQNDGLVWIEHTAVGRALSAKAGVPYFGAGDNGILDHKGACVVSIRAHGEGRNLQDRFSRSLVLTCPAAGDTWEQLLGRTHRAGQPADEVSYEAYLPCDDLMDAFRKAQADARYLEDTLGARQKINYCSIDIEGL